MRHYGLWTAYEYPTGTFVKTNMARLNIILSVSTFLFFLALVEDCQSRRPALSKIGH